MSGSNFLKTGFFFPADLPLPAGSAVQRDSRRIFSVGVGTMPRIGTSTFLPLRPSTGTELNRPTV